MTTEVLRNMLFTRSAALEGLEVVVLDEVHYLEDPYRGSVWEEVLVLTPPACVSSVCRPRSATPPTSGRGSAPSGAPPGSSSRTTDRSPSTTTTPSPSAAGRASPSSPSCGRSRPNPDGPGSRRPGAGASAATATGRPDGSRSIEYLAGAGMLPAITFIFSRAACDDATRQCLRRRHPVDHRRGTGPHPPVTEAAVERLGDDDLRTLGYGPWSAALEAGIAPHHAGLVPAFRQAVEQCFSAGLLKVVFATETLALGINMPARTVVVERFAKFRGPDTSPLTSGEYQQLTGRAGRRGIDTVGPRLGPLVGGDALRRRWPGRLSPRPRTWSPPSTPPTTWPSTWCGAGRGPRPRRWWPPPTASGRPRRVGLAGRPAGSAPGHPRGARLRRRLAADRAGQSWLRSTTSRICWWPTPCARGCSTGSARPRWPGWPRRCTFEARRVEGGHAAARRSPVVAERLERLGALAASLRADERRARPAPDPAAPIQASPGRWSPGPGASQPRFGAAGGRGRSGRLRAQRPPAHRPAPPIGRGGPRAGDQEGCRPGRLLPAPGRGRSRRSGRAGVRA